MGRIVGLHLLAFFASSSVFAQGIEGDGAATKVPSPPPTGTKQPGAEGRILQPPVKNDPMKEVAKILEGQKLSETGVQEFRKRVVDVYGADLDKAKQTLFFAEPAGNGEFKVLPLKYSPTNGFEPAHFDRPLLLSQYPEKWEDKDGSSILALRKEIEVLKAKLEASESARKALIAQAELLEKALKELSK